MKRHARLCEIALKPTRCPHILHYLLTLLLSLFSLSAATFGAPTGEVDLGAREQDLEQVETELRRLEQDLEGRKSERGDLLTVLERTERHIGDLARAGRQLAEMIAAQRRVTEDLDARVESETRTLRDQQLMLGGLLRSAYAIGRGEVFRLLMSQEEMGHFGRVTAYYGYFSEERARRIAELERGRESLRLLAERARQETLRLTVLAQEQDKTRLRLVAVVGERNDLLVRLEGTIASREDRITSLQEDAGALRAVIEQLRRSAQIVDESGIQQDSIALQRGRLQWPTAPVGLLARFGSPKDGNELRWDGVLLAADRGDVVRAVYHGRVVFADWLRGFGLLLIVDHGDGYMSLYGHNQSLLKETGEWVTSGDQLALSGASGGQRDAGVYFALRRNGEPLNPEKWCSGG